MIQCDGLQALQLDTSRPILSLVVSGSILWLSLNLKTTINNAGFTLVLLTQDPWVTAEWSRGETQMRLAPNASDAHTGK